MLTLQFDHIVNEISVESTHQKNNIPHGYFTPTTFLKKLSFDNI